jgi:hypothetical protein
VNESTRLETRDNPRGAQDITTPRRTLHPNRVVMAASTSKKALFCLKFADEYGGHRVVVAELTARQHKTLAGFMGSKHDHAQVFTLSEPDDEGTDGQLILLERLDDAVRPLFERLFAGIDSTALVKRALRTIKEYEKEDAEE